MVGDLQSLNPTHKSLAICLNIYVNDPHKVTFLYFSNFVKFSHLQNTEEFPIGPNGRSFNALYLSSGVPYSKPDVIYNGFPQITSDPYVTLFGHFHQHDFTRSYLDHLRSCKADFEVLIGKSANPSPKFGSVLLYDQPFSRYKVTENRKFWKCTE